MLSNSELIAKVPVVRNCGSKFIDRAFLTWLRVSIGEENYRHLDPNLDIDKETLHSFEGTKMRFIVRQFEERKRVFGPGSADCYLYLPAPLESLTIGVVVEDGMLKIPK